MRDPLGRRDWFVEAQARRFRSLGLAVPADAIQRSVAEDLRLTDRAKAEGALTVKSTPKRMTVGEAVAEKRSRKADVQAAAVNGTVRTRQLPAVEKAKRLAPLTGLELQRTYAMATRLRLIGQRSGTRLRTGQDMEHGFQYARLARAAAEETTNHDARRGPYLGVCASDRDRILYRRLQDVCDKSDAIVGFAWWVK